MDISCSRARPAVVVLLHRWWCTHPLSALVRPEGGGGVIPGVVDDEDVGVGLDGFPGDDAIIHARRGVEVVLKLERPGGIKDLRFELNEQALEGGG